MLKNLVTDLKYTGGNTAKNLRYGKDRLDQGNSGQPYIVGEAGAELFTPGQTGSITPNNAMGGNTVNININAVDAQGIDDLLNDRRALLVSVIQKSMREQGMRQMSHDL